MPGENMQNSALERWEFGDPEQVAIRREEKSCKGCQSIETVIIFGSQHNLRRRVAERSPLPKVQAEIVMTGDQASAVDGILVEVG